MHVDPIVIIIVRLINRNISNVSTATVKSDSVYIRFTDLILRSNLITGNGLPRISVKDEIWMKTFLVV